LHEQGRFSGEAHTSKNKSLKCIKRNSVGQPRHIGPGGGVTSFLKGTSQPHGMDGSDEVNGKSGMMPSEEMVPSEGCASFC
jgi:hypothetical protein